MKHVALSLREPWLQIILDGYKKVEFRGWCPKWRREPRYPFELLLCASKRPDRKDVWQWAHDEMFLTPATEERARAEMGMARGIVCVTNVVPIDARKHWDEPGYGDGIGFAWEMANVRRLVKPFPVKGQLGLFQIEVTKEMLEVTS